MVHLNELEAEYGPRGLSILGVTGEREGKPRTEAWVKGKGARYGFAYDRGSALQAFFKVRGIPHAILLDASGTVVWRGHPGQLDRSTLDQALAGALTLPVWEWPDEARAARQAFVSGDLGRALVEARRASGDGTEPVVAALSALVDGRLAAARRAHGEGDYRAAYDIARRAAKALAGLPQAKEAEELARRIDADPGARAVMEGQKTLERLRNEMGRVRTVSQAQGLKQKLDELAHEHPDTIVSREARELSVVVADAIRGRR